MRKKLTIETKQQIKRLFFEGLNANSIAERSGLGLSSVYSVTSKLPRCRDCQLHTAWSQKNRGGGYCRFHDIRMSSMSPACDNILKNGAIGLSGKDLS